MIKYVALFFAVGIAAITAGGVTQGFDTTTIVLLVVAVCLAVVGIAVARRFTSGTAGPAQCSACGGVIAPSSPYCKHCGTPR